MFYDKISDAYQKVYQRLGIGGITYKTFASGGSFCKYSHEFQTLSDVGEDTIYVHREKKIAINEEVLNDEVLTDIGVSREELVEEKAVEVGNIFTLGTRFSEPLKLEYVDESGKQKPVFMGSYGIGPSRLMGLLAEHFADEKGLVWPKNIAPAQVYLARLGEDQTVIDAADDLYHTLQEANIGVIYDDRDVRPGEKFGDADLLGIPYRVVVSQRMVEQSALELKERVQDDSRIVSGDELIEILKS
jgi:prolyl-tRNA synthetase